MTMSENSRNLEAGLLLRKNQNDINECRITAVVLFSTFVSVCGSFCFGCAVSPLHHFSSFFSGFFFVVKNNKFLYPKVMCMVNLKQEIFGVLVFTGRLFISCTNRDRKWFRPLCCTSKKQTFLVFMILPSLKSLCSKLLCFLLL